MTRIFVAAGLFAYGAIAYSQAGSSKQNPASKTSGQTTAAVQNVRPTATDASSGKEMFFLYCSSCHGLDGQGDSTAARAFKRPPPDLTLLSRRNGGKYPIARVEATIRGEVDVPAHGNRQMPMWGDVFRSMQSDPAIVKLRVHNLAEYVKSIQR